MTLSHLVSEKLLIDLWMIDENFTALLNKKHWTYIVRDLFIVRNFSLYDIFSLYDFQRTRFLSNEIFHWKRLLILRDYYRSIFNVWHFHSTGCFLPADHSFYFDILKTDLEFRIIDFFNLICSADCGIITSPGRVSGLRKSFSTGNSIQRQPSNYKIAQKEPPTRCKPTLR